MTYGKINDDIRDAIQSIYDAHGEVVPSIVVKEAKLKRSPLHDYFEWDDNEAAHQYRLNQARVLVRQVEVIHGDKKERLVHIPAIKHAKSKEGRYKPISVVVDNIDEYQLALNEALTKLRSAEKAVKDLENAVEDDTDKKALALALRSLSTAESAMNTLLH